MDEFSHMDCGDNRTEHPHTSFALYNCGERREVVVQGRWEVRSRGGEKREGSQ